MGHVLNTRKILKEFAILDGGKISNTKARLYINIRKADFSIIDDTKENTPMR